jgi:hypothetical protein
MLRRLRAVVNGLYGRHRKLRTTAAWSVGTGVKNKCPEDRRPRQKGVKDIKTCWSSGRRSDPDKEEVARTLPTSGHALYGYLVARMTPQEATAVNVLLGYFAGRPELPPREIVRSLEILANRAHNRLQAG